MRPYDYVNEGICTGFPYYLLVESKPIKEVIEHLRRRETIVSFFCLGCIYHLGIGIAVDYDRAIYFYEQSLQINYSRECLNNLGALYMKVGQFDEAQRYLLASALQGNDKAIKNLADMYEIKGDATTQFWLWEILAEKKQDIQALEKISEMYAQGIGVAKDISWSEKKCMHFLAKEKEKVAVQKEKWLQVGVELKPDIDIIARAAVDRSRIDLPWWYPEGMTS